MSGADNVIRWSTAAAVTGVAVVAAVVSYEHAYALVHAHGETGWTARLIPLTVDGLIWASSRVMLDSARRGVKVPALARWLLGLGIAATLAANVTHGLGHGPIGSVVAAWPAVALVSSYELLMMIIRSAQPEPTFPAVAGAPGALPRPDPLRAQAAQEFAGEVSGWPQAVDPGDPGATARRPASRPAGPGASRVPHRGRSGEGNDFG